MTFKKGSTRQKILDGLRELKHESVVKFLKIYGSQDPTISQTVHEVIAAIPREKLANALRQVENTVKRQVESRAAIQEAAKIYIEKTNKENLSGPENREAIKEATAKILPVTARNDIPSVVDAMGKMSQEIILSGIDTVINGKTAYTHARWNVTPEEIEKFMSAMREGLDPVTGVKVSKIGFLGNPLNYGVVTPNISDLVLRSDWTSPIPPEKDFYEYRAHRDALLEEVYALAGLTRDAGWFENDTPGIPKEKFTRAIDFIFMLPELQGNGYLPHGVTASPDGVVTFWWKHYKKKVTFSITNFGIDSWLLEYRGNFPQDNSSRFLTLLPGAIEYLVIELKKMYS